MAQQNVEVVRRFNAAVNRGDRKAAGAMVHPEVEWHTLAGPILGIQAVSGRDQVIRFVFEQIPEGIEDFWVTLGEVKELPGGEVLAVGRYEGRGVASGADVEMNAAAIYRLASGMIVFFQDFGTRDEALQAAAPKAFSPGRRPGSGLG